jgi:hypothetical protein
MIAVDRHACRNGSGVEDEHRAGLIEPRYEISGVESCDRDVAATRGANNRSIHGRDNARRFPGRRPGCYDNRDRAGRLGGKRESGGHRSGEQREQDCDEDVTHAGFRQEFSELNL